MNVRAMLDNVDERLWRIFGALRSVLPVRRELEELKVPAGNGTSRALVLTPHPDDESLALGGTLLFQVGGEKAIEVYLKCSARLYGECVRQIEPRAFSWLAPISGRQPMQFFAYWWNTLLTSAKARLIMECLCRR